jgi:predicted  nucleic acid-binding Zn-ribbon protein
VCQKDKENLAVHPGGIEYTALLSRILDLEREIRHLEEEAGKTDGRIHHISTEQQELSTRIESEMSELSDGSLKISGLPVTKEDQ